MRSTVNERINALVRGRDYLQAHDWIRENYMARTPDGVADPNRCCVLGALAVANGCYDNRYPGWVVENDLLIEVIAELQRDLPPQYDCITMLNDSAGTKDEVLAQVNQTIGRLCTEAALAEPLGVA